MQLKRLIPSKKTQQHRRRRDACVPQPGGGSKGLRTGRNLHLLQDDALGHGRATEGVRLHRRYGVGLVVVLKKEATKTHNKRKRRVPKQSREGRRTGGKGKEEKS